MRAVAQEFADILQHLLSPEESVQDHSETPQSEEPNAWWVLLSAPAQTVPWRTLPTAYPAKKPSAPRPRTTEAVIALDQLPSEAIVAAKFIFALAGVNCPPHLKSSEVKRLYRHLAIKLHPDSTHCCDSTKFRQLATHYALLAHALKTKSVSK